MANYVEILETGQESVKRAGHWITGKKDDFFFCKLATLSGKAIKLKLLIKENKNGIAPDSANWSVSGQIVTSKEIKDGKIISESRWVIADHFITA